MYKSQKQLSITLATVTLALMELSGCAAFTPVDVAKPSSITLEEATASVGRSLVSLKNELDNGGVRSGLIIDEVDVNLKVAAAATAGGTQKLTIDVANTALAGVGLGAEVTGQQTSSGNRDNSITLKFRNIYTTQLNKTGEARVKRRLEAGLRSEGTSDVTIFNCSNGGCN